MTLALFLLLSSVLIGGIELLKRVFSLSTDLTRRITHMGAALIAAVSPIFLNKWLIVSACLLFAILVFISRRSALLSSIHNVERKSFGDVFLPLGEAVSAAIFLPSIAIFQYGVLVMGISDALAGFIGERWGRHSFKFLGNSKSVEGSLAFWICTLAITFIFVHTLSYQVVILVTVLTAAEIAGVYGTDNLFLPILGAFLIRFLI